MKHASLFIAALILFVGTSSGLVYAAGVPELQQGNTRFSFDLYRALQEREGNLFFSPYSISTALAMTYAGARGETEKEMAAVLHLPPEQVRLHKDFANLQEHLNDLQDKGKVQLNVANALWAQEGQSFLDSFLKLTKKYYGAGVNFVDYAGATEAARKTINDWVEEQTRKKIQELIKKGMLDPSTTLVLCNAIYFKGDWLSKFEKAATRDTEFFVTPDSAVQVPMMNQSMDAKYRKFDGFSALELPYLGKKLSMVALLPEAKDGLPALEQLLSGDQVMQWLAELDDSSPLKVEISLPRFKTTCEFELSEILSKMGMPHAFSDADFSGMTGQRDLFISKIVHKAYVDVNEEGTEAAAATAVIMDKAAFFPLAFRADHPFIFLIRENKTGSILFLGRIVDPTK